eukprot:1474760-Pleurochrysis_carterae.AAC.2
MAARETEIESENERALESKQEPEALSRCRERMGEKPRRAREKIEVQRGLMEEQTTNEHRINRSS